MDRLDHVVTIQLPRLETLYQARVKLYEAVLSLSGREEHAAAVAADLSALGRTLVFATTGLQTTLATEISNQEIEFQMEFFFQEWLPGGQALAGQLASHAAPRSPEGWSIAKKYYFRLSDTPTNVSEIMSALTTKSKEELFDDLNDKNQELQFEIEERKSAQKAFEQAQRELVSKEKLAALGGLVAGIAHEINTPIGIGVTAASHASEAIRQINRLYSTGAMRKSDLEGFLASAQELNAMVEENLLRASELIKSFKAVAVDQTAEDNRDFFFQAYVQQVVTSLGPKLREWKNVDISLAGIDPKIQLQTSPGPISQILTNFIMNSLIHGFDQNQPGTITIAAKPVDDSLEIIYSDNGKGISPEDIKKIFDPFFTTKRAHGGSGLGMHLVYNIVTKKFSGDITCESQPGQGVTFRILLPGMFEQKPS